jgi:hypothetical protein
MCHLRTSLSSSGLAEAKHGWAFWAKKGRTIPNGRLAIYLQINGLLDARKAAVVVGA